MNRTLQSLLSIVVVLVVGLGAWQWVASSEAPPPKAPPRDLGPVPVAVAPLSGRDILLESEAFGNLESRRRATLAAEVSGRIVEVYPAWRPGALVDEGELLLRVDGALYELDVRGARAALAETQAGVESAEVSERRSVQALEKALERLTVAEREHERLVELGGMTTESLRDASLRSRIEAELARDEAHSARDMARVALATARARAESAQVVLMRAEEQLARTEIRAPFRGRLRGQAPGLGTLATPGMALGELIDPTQLVLTVLVPESELLLVRPGQVSKVSFPATPETISGPELEGRVVAVDAASDPLTRRGVVEIEFADTVGDPGRHGNGAENGHAGAHLPVGLFARTSIALDRLVGALWIDRRHFSWEGGEPVAYVLEAVQEQGQEGGLARRRVLELGREHGEGFVVVSGLAAGEVLILHPLDRLRDGVPVRVLERGAQADGEVRR